MKRTVKTSRAVGYLEKIFRTINQDSFGGLLEEPIITIQSKAGTYGHVTVGKVWNRAGEQRHELNICADWLSRPIEEVVATMIHEMAHLMNLQNGIQDCSRGGTYHNRKFKNEAEKHMISIAKHDKYGWTITTATEELLDYILRQGWDEIEMNRGLLFPGYGGSPDGKATGKPGAPTTATTTKPKGSNSKKHICPICGRIARTTSDFPLVCGLDFVEMEIEN